MKKLKAFISRDLDKKDWIIFFVVALICSLCYQQTDLVATVANSFPYLEGHIADFYTYNSTYFLPSAYLPTTYIIFATWNLPLYILGIGRNFPITELGLLGTFILVIWNKCLTSIAYSGCAFIVYKICLEFGLSNKISKLGAFLFVTTPIAFFSQFVFGQYDAFITVFVLLGFYFYLKDKFKIFAICFAIAFTFKYTAIAIFIPLLLLKQKKIIEIVKYVVMVILPALLMLLFYQVFGAGMNAAINFADGKMGFITNMAIQNGYFSISLVVLLFIVLCAFAYFYEPNESVNQISIFLCNCVMFLLFGLSMWHPQWVLLATPFWVISTLLCKNIKGFLLIDMMMMVFYTLITITFFAGWVDQELFRLGILSPFIMNHSENYLVMSKLMPFDVNLSYSIFAALCLLQMLFKLPQMLKYTGDRQIDMQTLRARFLIGVGIFVIPSFICYFSMLNSSSLMINTTTDSNLRLANLNYQINLGDIFKLSSPNREEKTLHILNNSTQYMQVFTASGTHISKIVIPIEHSQLTGSDIGKIKLFADNGEVLYEIALDEMLLSNNMLIIDCDIPLQKDAVYKLEISSNLENGCLNFIQSGQKAKVNKEYVIINGEKQEFSLQLKIYE